MLSSIEELLPAVEFLRSVEKTGFDFADEGSGLVFDRGSDQEFMSDEFGDALPHRDAKGGAQMRPQAPQATSTDSILTERSLARGNDYEIDANQEFFVFGSSNMGSVWWAAFPATEASPVAT